LLTTNNTVAVSVGTLLPVAQGTFTIQAVTNNSIAPGSNFVTTATAAFTLPTNAQDSAVAYVLNSVVAQNNNLAGLALFGYGFFPTTLFGWILLLGLLLLLILIGRYYYHRANAHMAATTPVSHTYTTSNTTTGYNGNNLPH